MLEVKVSQEVGRTFLQKAHLFYGPSNGNFTVMTEHDLEIINGVPVIKEGAIMNRRSLKKVATGILKQKESGLCFIDSKVLAKDDESIVWWEPACKRRIFFNAADEGLRDCNAVVEHPSLVFAKVDKRWFVLAVAGKERPTLATPLLVSPYYNVWDSHLICAGSTNVPNSLDPTAWTDAFFRSAFTHTNYRHSEHKLKRKGDRAGLWRALINGKLKTFPISSLPAANMTLGQFIETLNQHD